ncbi:hypothetical protein [Kitasatospora purpeofusca]|uniref:hypothetical protein n=1 Tax=Kitasatospora purpeofusca TaxID=67352 RepID=UPI002E0F8B57|nr:hypothetical protein OG196_15245 [Kitasatospora purpeofusca]
MATNRVDGGSAGNIVQAESVNGGITFNQGSASADIKVICKEVYLAISELIHELPRNEKECKGELLDVEKVRNLFAECMVYLVRVHTDMKLFVRPAVWLRFEQIFNFVRDMNIKIYEHETIPAPVMARFGWRAENMLETYAGCLREHSGIS